MKHLVVTEEIWKEDNMYTAYCLELDVVSCGRNIEEAGKNLLEVIEIHLKKQRNSGLSRRFANRQHEQRAILSVVHRSLIFAILYHYLR